MSLVLSALQAGNKGTQSCITAANAVSGIIADLDTTIMFASAGTLNAENEESFADHRWASKLGDGETMQTSSGSPMQKRLESKTKISEVRKYKNYAHALKYRPCWCAIEETEKKELF